MCPRHAICNGRTLEATTMSKKSPPERRSRKDLEQAVVRKAVLDEGFRKKLMADPRGAVEQVLGEEVPGAKLSADLDVKAIEEPRDCFYLVVPRGPGELDETQLEQVSGGIRKIFESI